MIHRAFHNMYYKGKVIDKYNRPAWVPIALCRNLNYILNEYKPDFVLSCEDRRSNSLLRRKIYPK